MIKKDIKNHHRLYKSKSKNTIERFANRKFCKQMLDKKFDLSRMDFTGVGLGSNTKLLINENLAPYYQKLWWKWRNLKTAGLIYSTWSSKGVMKFWANSELKTCLNPLITNPTKWSNILKKSFWQIFWVRLTVLWDWHLQG